MYIDAQSVSSPKWRVLDMDRGVVRKDIFSLDDDRHEYVYWKKNVDSHGYNKCLKQADKYIIIYPESCFAIINAKFNKLEMMSDELEILKQDKRDIQEKIDNLSVYKPVDNIVDNFLNENGSTEDLPNFFKMFLRSF